MSEYRVRSTGEVKSQGAIRKSMPNTSLPRIWTEEICDFLGVDPVEVVNQPKASGEYKVFDRNGVAEMGCGHRHM